MDRSRIINPHTVVRTVPNRMPFVLERPLQPDPWPIRLLAVISPTFARSVADRYRAQSNSGQIVGTADPYATKLQTAWRSGRGGQRDDPLYPINGPPSPNGPWPNTPGSISSPLNRVVGKDPRPARITPRPQYLPRQERVTLGHTFPETTTGSGTAGGRNPFSLNTPMRIGRPIRAGLDLMAGPSQWGTRQTWGWGPDSIVIAPVLAVKASKGRGVRSVMGIRATRIGTGRSAVPAVFTPRNTS